MKALPEHRSKHQQRCDRREDNLEIGQSRHREEEFFFGQIPDVRLFEQAVAIEDGAWLPPHIPQETGGVAEDVHRLAERQLEAHQHPEDEYDCEGGERHHHRVDGPAFLHDSAIENDQTRDAHQAHQRGGRELPGIGTFAQIFH
jgi:hypothetical protein